MPTSPRDPDKFAVHAKGSAAQRGALNAYLNAHLAVNGLGDALDVAENLENLMYSIGGPDTRIRAAFLAYLATVDADYLAAVASYNRAEAYATAAMKDDAP